MMGTCHMEAVVCSHCSLVGPQVFGVTLAFIYDFLPHVVTLQTLEVNVLPVRVQEDVGTSPDIASFFRFSPNDPIF